MRISDWSSDVCSSDLDIAAAPFAEGKVLSGHDARRAQFPDQLSRDEILRRHAGHRVVEMENKHGIGACGREQSLPLIQCCQAKGRKVRKEMRSEERRVGKEGVRTCRIWRSAYHK